jgi:hypothetical protein
MRNIILFVVLFGLLCILSLIGSSVSPDTQNYTETSSSSETDGTDPDEVMDSIGFDFYISVSDNI